MRLSRKLAVATAIAGAVSLLIPSSSYAVGAGVTVVTGGGNIFPGLTPLAHTPQAVNFTGTAVGVAAGVAKPAGPDAAADAGVLACNFAGGSVGSESSGLGQGTVSGGCGGTGGFGTNVAVNCPQLAYDRFGPLVVVYGDGHVHTTVSLGPEGVVNLPSAKCTVTATGLLGTVVQTVAVYGVFVFAPTSNPTTSYLLAGATVGLTQVLPTL